MSAFSSRGASAYASIGIETGVISASPSQLIVMLYEGAIVAIALAQQHLQKKDIAARGSAISKAISIINDGLKASLDLNVGGELAQNLSELYTYMAQCLLQANIKNNHTGFEEVRQLLLQLKGAWETLAASPAAGAAGPGTAPMSRGSGNTYG